MEKLEGALKQSKWVNKMVLEKRIRNKVGAVIEK
jgi:hypothetical protein